MTYEEAVQAIKDQIPATGEVSYTQVHSQLILAGKFKAIRQFHHARRAGAFNVRVDSSGDRPEIMLSKVSA